MAKTRGGHSFRLRVRPSSLPPAAVAPAGFAALVNVVALANVVVPAVGQSTPSVVVPTASPSIPSVMVAIEAAAPALVAPAPCRYDTRVGPTAPSPPHPRPSRRALPLKRAQTLGTGESSSSRP